MVLPKEDEVLQRLTHPENLRWAFAKAKRLYSSADGLVDFEELAAFELNLEASLQDIRRRFLNGRYRLRPLALLPQPKKPKGDGPRMRQSFAVSVQDQVAWIAVINVIGPALDLLMPPWSYGHRLYRAPWVEEDEAGHFVLNVGPFRHSNGQLYRRFRHSWPLYRRHVVLSARAAGMGRLDPGELDEPERAVLSAEDKLSAGERLPFLNPKFWKSGSPSTVYAASIDLKTFYPSINVQSIIRNLQKYSQEYRDSDHLRRIVDGMLAFRVDTSKISEVMAKSSEPTCEPGVFSGIPTGLMVAGFLSNIAMLDIDRRVRDRARRKRVAHFRFVDDHTIIATQFEDLVDWIKWYEKALSKSGLDLRLNHEKTNPPKLADFLEDKAVDNDLKSIRTACSVDSRMPSRLLTTTLAQVSIIGQSNFDLFSEERQVALLEQLRGLLLGDLPETEIPADTRAAFAAGRLAEFVPRLETVNEEAIIISRKIAARDYQGRNELKKLRRTLKNAIAAQEKTVIKTRKTYFEALFTAIERHPEKVRLIDRTISFCRQTGHHGLLRLLNWVRDYHPGSAQQAYLRAFLLQVLAGSVLRSTRALMSDDVTQALRRSAREHLRDLRVLRKSDLRGNPRDCFHARASRALEVSLATAIANLSSVDKKLTLVLQTVARRLESAEWAELPERLSPEQFATWLYWAEAATQKAFESTPGAAWSQAAQKLDPLNDYHFALLRLYPGYCPDVKGLLEIRAKNFRRSDEGWLHDLLSLNPGNIPSIKYPGAMGRVIASLKNNQNGEGIPLGKWVSWTSRTAKSDPFDPRVGEWTALEIIDQIAAIIARTKGPRPIHHSAFLVDSSWEELPPNGVPFWTWEDWRRWVREAPLKVNMHGGLYDYRVFSEELGYRDPFSDRSLVTALGLLLLGLLRRSFAYPARWNIRGHERSSIQLFAACLEELPISAGTASVLEACLGRRPTETAVYKFFPKFGQLDRPTVRRDTDFDPPIITTIHEFADNIQACKKILEQRQISVLYHQPRQLIPVSVFQGGMIKAQEEE